MVVAVPNQVHLVLVIDQLVQVTLAETPEATHRTVESNRTLLVVVPVVVAQVETIADNSWLETVAQVAKPEFAATLKNSAVVAAVAHTVGGITPTAQITHRVLRVLVVLAEAAPVQASSTTGRGLALAMVNQTPAAAAVVLVVTVTPTPSVVTAVLES
jgi:hypothetical protein